MLIGKSLDGDDIRLSTKDVATSGTTILAMRGAGKSWLAGVLAEQMALEKIPFAIIDPEGEYWTLRANFSNIVVVGGEHGDVPLDISIAETIAQISIDERLEIIIDLSDMRRRQQYEFLEKFLTSIFTRETKVRIPFWVCLEEADLWVPQTGNPLCKIAVLDLCQRGRKRGLGFTLVSQRPAVIDKTALSQAEFRFFKRFSQPHDLRAVADYLSPHAHLTKILPSLSTQEALFYAPTINDKPLQIVVASRITPHGGTTPTGVKTVKPSTTTLLMKQKLEKILEEKRKELAEIRTQESKIKALQERIHALEKELEKTRLASDVASILSRSTSKDQREKESSPPPSMQHKEIDSKNNKDCKTSDTPLFTLLDEMIVFNRSIKINLHTGHVVGSELVNMLLNRLNPNERVIFLTLMVRNSKLSATQLSKITGWSANKVRKIIKQLIRKGVVKSYGRSKGGILYFINI